MAAMFSKQRVSTVKKGAFVHVTVDDLGGGGGGWLLLVHKEGYPGSMVVLYLM